VVADGVAQGHGDPALTHFRFELASSTAHSRVSGNPV